MDEVSLMAFQPTPTQTPTRTPMQTQTPTQTTQRQPSPPRKVIAVASIATGIQFAFALQVSLLTPYVQLLGIPHQWASLIWLCGPVSSLLVQPVAGYYSDRCSSRYGRRRPFIALGTLLVVLSVILIGYASDLGRFLGDPIEKKVKTRAIVIFVVGFWILDIANSLMGAPCRALLADLAAGCARTTRTANAFFTFFTAVGAVLGYGTGMLTRVHDLFPFTLTAACDVSCANLKSSYFLCVALLLVVVVSALWYVREPEEDEEPKKASNGALIGEIFMALKGYGRPMWVLMVVTGLNWVAVYPFLIYNMDWMRREVYGGDNNGDVESQGLYNAGASAGALGMLMNAVVVGLMSLCVEWVGRVMGGAKRLWGVTNFFLAVCLVMMVPVSRLAQANRRPHGSLAKAPPPDAIKNAALALFALQGISQAVTLTIPFAFASIFSSDAGAGQGLSLGVLNLAIVIPQMVVSLGSGPFDQLLGGGNLPAFMVGAAAAAISGVLALTLLPSPPPDSPSASPKTTPLAVH